MKENTQKWHKPYMYTTLAKTNEFMYWTDKPWLLQCAIINNESRRLRTRG